MKKKRYIQPEIEVVNLELEGVIQTISAVDVVDTSGNSTGDNIGSGGESNNEDDLGAPVFFPDLD